jgi:hypothetical protein
MQLDMRLATIADAEAAGMLLDAMDLYYRGLGGSAGPAAASEMVRRTISAQEGTKFFLAFAEHRPIGIACFAVLAQAGV